jgi:capsular polysaccharide biosynthesis protein
MFNKKVQKISSDVVWLIDDWSNNYYHWNLDILPKFELLLDKNIRHHCVLLPTVMSQKRYVSESLVMYGLTPIYYDVSALVRIEKGLGVRFLGYDNFDVQKKVSKRMQSLIAMKPIDNTATKVYISRNDSTKRRILNEEDFISRLETMGFMCYDLSSMSWADQIRLFFHAEAIIGVHGAGLANIIYARSGSTIIEIQPKSSKNIAFKYISQKMQLNYFNLEVDTGSLFDMQMDNFFIDVESAISQIEKWTRSSMKVDD